MKSKRKPPAETMRNQGFLLEWLIPSQRQEIKKEPSNTPCKIRSQEDIAVVVSKNTSNNKNLTLTLTLKLRLKASKNLKIVVLTKA